MSRPTGVTIVAVVLMVTGVFTLLLGLEGAGVTVILSGILSLIAAFGLFTLKSWAWYLAVIVLVFRVVADAFGFFMGLMSSNPTVTFANLAITAILLWYFFQPQVKSAFGIGEKAV